MDTLLLATKLQVPPQPHHVVHRARLIETLDSGIHHYKLIHISAPAGFGKTTLLVQWTHSSRHLIAWLSVSEADNDLQRFLRYLLAAWEKVQPGIMERPVGLLLGGTSPDSTAVLPAFINAANEVPGHVVFVIDDYHLIELPSIHQALTFLLDHLPPSLHFVLAGRAEPPLPLARYRARGELLELRADDLQFLLEETTDFLKRQMQLDLPNEAAIALHGQLEGWIAGLQLAALTLRRHGTTAKNPLITGKHRFIADYLSENVLARLPDELRRFLLQTSILDRLCGSLCDAITGKRDGQETLKILERENLFIVPLDDSREWFRYHWLFGSFLQEELMRLYPKEVVQLHRKAARWYMAHDWPEEAFHHAIKGEDAELGNQIGEHYFDIKLLSGEFTVLEHWLELLPAQWYSDYPLIGLAQVSIYLFTGAFDEGVRNLDHV